MREMANPGSPAQAQGTVATDSRDTSVALRDKDSDRSPAGQQAASGQVANGRPANGRAGNGKVSKRDSDEIVAEIERTRQNLARTIDSLADKVSPASNVRRLREEASGQTQRLREQASEQLARPEVQLVAAAVGLAIVGIAIYRIWGRRRS
jgi:Protein of unknown function (DUF3618)